MNKKSFLSPTLNALPKAGEGLRGEKEGRIGYLLRQANAAHRLKIERILVDFDLTLPQYAVLFFCKLYPGVSNADLARLTLLTPQTVSIIVANLERKGYIARHAHAVHGRIQQIAVTKDGGALLKKCDKPILKSQQQLVAGFSMEEQKIIRRWLVSVAKE